MAESKFLKYQDKDGNGLIDVCDDVISIPEVNNCPDCLKDPSAITPNWKNRTKYEPFLNQKLCEYQITVQTEYTTTADSTVLEQIENNILDSSAASESLDEKYEEYVTEAIEALLDYYEKDNSDASRLAIKAVIDYAAYDLDPRPKSRLKLLYSVPYTDLNALVDAADDEDEEDEGDEVEVTYEPSDLQIKLIRIRKTLQLYSRYQKAYTAVDGGSLYYIDSGSDVTFSLDDYGDLGFLPGTSILSNIVPQLDAFLNQKGYDIPFAGKLFGGLGMDKVVKLVFKFTPEYELKKLTIYTQGCGEKPILFTKKLESLKKQSAFKDRTAMAYLAQLDDMDRDLLAREPGPWLDFVMEYTYPELYSTVNAAYANTDPVDSVGSCMADALAEEGKQLGQDILDEVFGIGDAVAYAFRDSICQDSDEDEEEDEKKEKDSLLYMAREQLYASIKDEDPIFEKICMMFLLFGKSGLREYGTDLDEIWKNIFDPMKKCGLFDLLLGVIDCLLGGLTLEKALAGILKTALRSMSLEYFGDLFVGLPPEKQAELDALVQKNLESGEMFDKNSSDFGYTAKANDGDEDPPLLTSDITFKNPGEMAEEQKTASTTGSTTTRTLTVEYDAEMAETAKSGLNDKVIIEAYIIALLEVFQDNYLELLDIMNRYPGAQMIARIIATFKCPRPPLKPDIADFLKSIQLPFCRDKMPIIMPRLFNPADFDWSILRIIFDLIKLKIQEALIEILFMLMRKLCELIGNAICKALETVGDLAAALPAMVTGRTTFKDAIRESICGEDVDEGTINDTIVDMVATLGVGGAALADTEQVLSFAEDISASTTRGELFSAFLGDPSDEFLGVVETLKEIEYPDYNEALSNKHKIGRFFKNMGNLMPLDFRDKMKAFVDSLPEQDMMPANPTLCATPEQLDNFKELRCQLLEGRATKEQCDQMYDNLERGTLDDLDEIGNVMQNFPQFLADSMPPVMSAPGCDDGFFPFESDEAASVASENLSNGLEQLKLAFSYDMLGNGPFPKQWGFINMIMSDTMGNPFTAHKRKTFFKKKKYVDFYVDLGQSDYQQDADTDPTGGTFADVWKQKGAYPNKIAEWLEEDLQTKASAGISFASNNDVEDDEITSKDFEDFNISNFRGSPQHLLMLPDMGYNVERGVDIENEQITFNRKARKATPDVTLTFYDNGQGEAERKKTYTSGFEMMMYVSDMEESGSTYINRFDDNVRILINEIINTANMAAPQDLYKTDEEKEEDTADDRPIINRQYEFLSVDDTLSEIDTTSYTEFLSAFEVEQSYMPQVILLKEMINEQGYSYTNSSIKSLHDDFMSSIMTEFMTTASENSASFIYGAVFDDLTADDITYVVDDGQTEDSAGTEYFEAKVDDGEGGTREIKNNDQILGISKMQYERGEEDNRVIYLDPIQFGGSYMNPPIYIKPLYNEGWLGFIDVMFPEISPCKPYRTDIIDFGDIDDKISEAYQTIPDDDRLLSDPDCVVEKPYNRILERQSAAGLQGLIMAAIRIYVSTHFMKSMTTFTTFYPKFPETFSSMYASYITEVMEVAFKDAQKAGWEFFNPFKDEEFWYAFLEQSVQMYARRVDSGEIEHPSPVALNACIELNDMQESYGYPDRQDLREAKGLDEVAEAALEAAIAGPGGAAVAASVAASDATVSIFKTLKNYRSEKNLEAVQETEDLAKLVLKELVIEQLNIMGEKFIENLKIIGMTPSIYNLDYFLLTNLTQGGIDLDLNKEIKEETAEFPTEGEEHYTAGGELYVSDKLDDNSEFEQGDDYIGYYHVSVDENGDIQFMAGEFHQTTLHDILKPFASKVTVPIGDIEEYEYDPGSSSSKPFVIEKYININGNKYAPSDAQDEILDQDNALNLADVYPGTLEVVTDANDEGVGLEGELGVRYGLQFSMYVEGTKVEITSVEVDALDLPIGQFAPFEGDSKLLLCLINLLSEDDKFKLISRYIFPLNKVTAMIAIYNDLAFLKSIGEKTVEVGDYRSGGTDIGSKPGSYINSIDGDTGIPIVNEGKVGWANVADRGGLINNPFIKTWDEWDKEVLIQSKSRIKRLFKGYYNSRDFTAGDLPKDAKIGKIFLNELRERFKPAAGRNLLPWWKLRMLRTNPFNANDELCENNE